MTFQTPLELCWNSSYKGHGYISVASNAGRNHKPFRLGTVGSKTVRRAPVYHRSRWSPRHTVFCGLQEHICIILKTLPNDVDPTLRTVLTDAHRKLSDYLNKFDQSEYYTWATRKSFCSQINIA
jgi:hypothetical protein